jgi:hypothetical protein
MTDNPDRDAIAAGLPVLAQVLPAYRQCMAVLARVPWRQGRREGVHLYVQLGPEPSDDDLPIGTLFTEELAAEAVAAHNAMLGLQWLLAAGLDVQVAPCGGAGRCCGGEALAFARDWCERNGITP